MATEPSTSLADPFWSDGERNVSLYHGDCCEVMRSFPDNSVDTICTDPPYGLEFMGKEWDSPHKQERAHFHDAGFGGRDRPTPYHGDGCVAAMHALYAFHYTWATEALRIAKPGAILLAFGGTRTSHRLTCALEDAGWIIRDTISWWYGSGFPKSLDLSKAMDKAAGAEREDLGPHPNARKTLGIVNICKKNGTGRLTAPSTPLARRWSGWGTGLKPAWEPIILAMKPLDGTFVDNAKKWGVAGLNVDGGRIVGEERPLRDPTVTTEAKAWGEGGPQFGGSAAVGTTNLGRFPANLILGCACDDGEHEPDCPVRMLDEQSGVTTSAGGPSSGQNAFGQDAGWNRHRNRATPICRQEDRGGASRFFYTAKASRSERERGLIGRLPCAVCGGLDTDTHIVDGKEQRCFRNNHPTVKPISLMRYLVRLTATPMGGIVLDPFCGSGSTGIACIDEHRDFIGIDQDQHYLHIARWRMTPTPLGGLFAEPETASPA